MHTRSSTTRKARARGARLVCALVLVGRALLPAEVVAQETSIGDVDVVHGQGEVTVNEEMQTTLTSEGDVIYEWSGIDQPTGHTLEFDQASSGDTALNRGRGQNPFEFYGTVKSNGSVIFANEAGVHFRDGSSVQVYNLIAAAGDITNQDFLDGTLRFQGLEGAVTNAGTIYALEVSLLGERVANHGDIYVEDGKLLMAAGDEVWIRELDSPIVIKVPLDGHSHGHSLETTSVENTGLIDAGERGSVRLAAADGLAYAIRNHVVDRIAAAGAETAPESGVIRAGAIAIEAGEGGGVEIGGTLDATRWGRRAIGGEIDVFGERILVDEGARIDATGSDGGGRIRIGGDVMGGGDAPRAALVVVDEGAEIRADADYAGDGGEVVIWSDGHAYVHGTVSARGGEYGGNGGFVETSGLRYLDVTRAASVATRAGRAADLPGEWLIDPYDIIIGEFDFEDCSLVPNCLDDGIDLDDLFFVNNPLLFAVDQPSLLNAQVVADALTEGSNLTITTSTGTEELGEGLGNIIVQADILPGEGANENTAVVLTLRAANDIIIDADIGADVDPADPDRFENLNLGVQLIANDNAGQREAEDQEGEVPNVSRGNVTINGHINTNRSDVLIQAVDVTLGADGQINTDGGDVLIAAIGSIDPNTGNLRGGGSAFIEGDIDTSNSRTDEQGDELEGGTVTVQARVGLVGQVGAPPESARPQGGSILVTGDITLGEHAAGTTALDLEALGGDVVIGDALDPNGAVSIQSGGGDVEILAVRVAQDPAVEGGQENGGRVTLSGVASITTEGGDVEIEATGSFNDAPTSRDFETEVEIFGRIDTSPAEGDEDADGDGLVDTVGGDVLVRAEGSSPSNPSGRVSIIDERGFVQTADREDPENYLIYTAGGDVEVNFDVDLDLDGLPDGNSFASVLLAASVHAGLGVDDAVDVALEDARFGQVVIDAAGALTFENRSGSEPYIVRGEQVGLRSANRSPVGGATRGDLVFESTAGIGPEIWASDIEISAGTDSALGFFETRSRVVANDLVLRGPNGGSEINSLTWAQNASIDDASLPTLATFGGDATALDDLIYVIRSMTGSVQILDPGKLNGTASAPGEEGLGAFLELMAETDIDLGSDAVDGNLAAWEATNLQSLDLTLNQGSDPDPDADEEGFTVDRDLAARASAAADDIIITTGRRTSTRADLRVEDGVVLDAETALRLQAGAAGGPGDVVFGTLEGGTGDTILLRSRALELWAGSGLGTAETTPENRVLASASSPTRVEFDLFGHVDVGGDGDVSNDELRRFSLRQQAEITDDDVPDIDQFVNTGNSNRHEIGLVAYELRSDSAFIRLGWEGAQKLQRTDLSLLARNDPEGDSGAPDDAIQIDLGVDEGNEPRQLEVRTLDVGSTRAFQVNQQLLDQFAFAGPDDTSGASPSAITLRSGVSETGNLTFEVRTPDANLEDPTLADSQTIITADEIRLVASDGPGGNGATDGGASPSFVIVHSDVRFRGLPNGSTTEGETTHDPVGAFLLRQDAGQQVIVSPDGITSSLPDIDVNFAAPVNVAEGEDEQEMGLAPDVYALQVDDGTIQLSFDLEDSDGELVDFTRRLPLANEQVILSAFGVTSNDPAGFQPGVLVSRIDGRDLDMRTIFSADGVSPILVEIRSDTIELAAADAALSIPDEETGEVAARPPPEDLTRVIVGDVADEGLYVYGFGDVEFVDPLELPAPPPVDLEPQEGKTGSIPEVLSIRQDATIVADELLDLSRSGSGHGLGRGPCPAADPDCADDRRRTSYLLSSFHGDIEISPEKTWGGRIVLDLPLAPQDDLRRDSRTIRFASGPDLVFFTESFEVLNSFGWRVGAAGQPLTIQAADFISLRAGAAGIGDLTFEADVTLQSEDIRLGAFGPVDFATANVNLPIVDAITNAPTFDFFQPDPDRDDSDDDRFAIQQDGWINDTWIDRPAVGTRRTLPLPDQLVVDGGSGATPADLFAYTLRSNRRGVSIRNLEEVEASRLLVFANFEEVYDVDPDSVDRPGLILIDHTPGDGYDYGGLTPPADIDFAAIGIDRAALIGDEIRLVAGDGGVVDGTGRGVSPAPGTDPLPSIFYAGNTGPDAPVLAFTIEQDQSFIADGSAEDNTALLPAFFQFSNGITGVEYTLRLREGGGGEVQIGRETANRVRGTRLVIEALDDVKIDVPEVLLEGLVLTSLDVRENPDAADGNLVIALGNVFDPLPDLPPPDPPVDPQPDPDPDYGLDVVSTLIETGEGQRYDGVVQIKGLVELRGGDIEFTGDVAPHPDALVAGTLDGLDFLTRGTISFAGNVGCDTMSGPACEIAGDAWTDTTNVDHWLELIRVRFDADDPARDALAFVGDGPQSVFARDVSVLAVSPIEDFENLDAEVIRTPDVASIYKVDGDYDPESDASDTTGDALAFYTETGFSVAQGQKISSQGTFEAHSRDLVRIGDVGALEIDLVVDETSGAIEIERRSASDYITPDGRVLRDAGVSLVTNSIRVNVAPTLSGAGRRPSLAIEDPTDPSLDETLSSFTLTAIDAEGSPLTLGDFEWQIEEPPEALPALHAFGPPRNDTSGIFVGEEITPPPAPWMPSEWRVAQARSLRELMVRPRERSPDEWRRYLAGAGIIDDIGRGSARRDGLVTVAQARLLAQDAERAIALYERVFGPDGVRAPAVRAILAEALERYRRSSGSRRVVGFEFRRYVKNRPSSLFDAYQVFEDLDALFDHHRALGLTAGEYRPIQAAWLAQIQPEGITVDELAEAVHPSRYVRGTDILEIFGN